MTELLPKEFAGTGEVKGFQFKQLEATDKAYLYEVNTGESIHYEVFERKSSPICIDFEKRIYSETDFKETYPNRNAFGVWAYSCMSIERAQYKIDQLSVGNHNVTT